MTEIEYDPTVFQGYPKIGRLNRDIIITEKIDGTNAAIRIADNGGFAFAQSRTKIITPEADNFGFARWAHANAVALEEALGPGLHFGEWWGSKIQRTYGLAEKRFSLFNVTRWADLNRVIGDVTVAAVPKLYEGAWFHDELGYAPAWAIQELRTHGSTAARGFDKPEGIVVFHSATGTIFKVTLEKDEKHKGEA